MKLSDASDVLDFNDKFHKLVGMAREQNNFNAYGWLMRYMQVEEDMKTLEKRFIDIISHVKRIEDELNDNREEE